MTKQYIGVAIIFIIIAGAIFLGLFFENKNTNETAQAQDDNVRSNLSSYTLGDVAHHANADDCWIVVDGGVYDVTSYVSEEAHPGGQDSLLSGCGKEETDRFEKIHSSRATEELKPFLIGIIN